MKKLVSVMLGLWLLLGALSLSAKPQNSRSHFRTVSSKSKFNGGRHHGKKFKRNRRTRVRR